MNKIRIRDDDVGMESSGCNSFKRFSEIHGWILESTQFIHVPTIIVKDMEKNKVWMNFVRNETTKGNMLPEIHGYEHIDYAKLSFLEITKHLDICKEFIFNEFGFQPTKFYTPWGANAPHIKEASTSVGLEMIDCSNIIKLRGRYSIIQRLIDKEPLSNFYGQEIFMHFWEMGARLKRIIEVSKYGSWEEAKNHNKELFA